MTRDETMKCKICNRELFAGHGTEIAAGVFVCDTTDCAEFAIGVVEAAREVVEARDDDTPLLDAEIASRRWDAIERLREALNEG